MNLSTARGALQNLERFARCFRDCTQELVALNPRERLNVANVLRGIAAAQILTTGLEMFGEFVERLDHAHASMEIERALDQALPALRIPHGAGRFKKLAARGKLPSVETWAERFRALQVLADDALGLRRDGMPLNRAVLKLRLQELAVEGAVTEDERDALASLVEDNRIEPGKWRPTQAAAAELRWVAVERLVKVSKRKMQQPLGEATLALFREKMPDELGDEEKAVLNAMAADAEAADDEVTCPRRSGPPAMRGRGQTEGNWDGTQASQAGGDRRQAASG